MLHTSLLGFGLDVLLGDKIGFVNACGKSCCRSSIWFFQETAA